MFLWDSGSSVGEITGHNKVINSVDIKQTRPYRLATGSDDNCAAFFEGPPFKFKFTISVSFKFRCGSVKLCSKLAKSFPTSLQFLLQLAVNESS